ncbi:chromate transporter [[Clostridium] symbiosum]|uniref:chromate transporter n=1 Tax=Clostridium symbiosum TaxID=1512 RepID=UPI001D07778E|nr:chromate transporter [[Clostridium] symbiosum]MCB6607131.1 chromate transporter [[Clostridium] symbiosum]MCB6929691.1 chromate transporter [[Clostridium] symbiosum]
MIYLSLFWEFFKIGLFAFGGAYGAIPLIKESVITQGWLNETMFGNMVALSESTPGPIMVNAATYIGASQAGVCGAMAATLGVILPSFVIILFVTMFLRKWLKHKNVQVVLRGIKPCLMGIILATGVYMAFTAVFGGEDSIIPDWSALVILIALTALSFVYPLLKKKEFSPILLIVIAAAFGIVMF